MLLNLPLPKAETTLYCCPVCNGAGKVSRPPWLPGDVLHWSAGNNVEHYECQACKGKGYIER